MISHDDFSDKDLFRLLRWGVVQFAGNRKLKIYGILHCRSGRRMLRRNRMFFSSAAEAHNAGYRPCGHCMKKVGNNRVEDREQ
ncbi:MAG TPA: Ada metal-binding domain-containing protein [Chryseosolibacter sp.]|nr:Ada metal-binding domain-containing protein [Chryseosolibacter sp.]